MISAVSVVMRSATARPITVSTGSSPASAIVPKPSTASIAMPGAGDERGRIDSPRYTGARSRGSDPDAEGLIGAVTGPVVMAPGVPRKAEQPAQPVVGAPAAVSASAGASAPMEGQLVRQPRSTNGGADDGGEAAPTAIAHVRWPL